MYCFIGINPPVYEFAGDSFIKEKKKKKVKGDKLGELQLKGDFKVDPSEISGKLDTSQWPLLLKVILLFY